MCGAPDYKYYRNRCFLCIGRRLSMMIDNKGYGIFKMILTANEIN